MSKFLVDAFKYGQVGKSYEVTANTTNVNEGQTVQFDINTTGVPDGNTLYWSIEYISGNAATNTVCATAGEGASALVEIPFGTKITSVDFASYGRPGGSCGSFTLGGCHATTSQSVVESYILNQAGPQNISVPASNAIFGDPCGGQVKWLYIQATATNVDFVQGLTGSFTLPTNQVQITVNPDRVTEGTESFQLFLRDGNAAGTVLANSPTVTIADTSLNPTFSITAADSIDEGSLLSYTINTTNIPDGEIIYWYITGTVSGADFSNSAMSGTVTISANTNATALNKLISNDSSFGEGGETMIMTIHYPNGTPRASKTTTINDTSALSPAARMTGGTILNPGDGWRYHIARGAITLTVTTAGVADMWLIGGGGGGGGSSPTAGSGGGGGSGGLQYYNENYFGPGPSPVGIGAGGGGGASARGGNATLTRLGPAPAPGVAAYGGGGGGRGIPGALPSYDLINGLADSGGGGGGAGGFATTVPPDAWGIGAESPTWQAGAGGYNWGGQRGGAGGGGTGGGGGGPSGFNGGDGGVAFKNTRFPGPAIFPAFNPIGAIPARIGQPIFDPDGTFFGGGGGGGAIPPNANLAGNGGGGGGGGGGSAGPRATTAGRANSGSGGGANPGTGSAGGSGIAMFRYDLSR